MPLPIIHRQRALSQVGEIRVGGEKEPNKPGRKLESFRLTSQYQEIIETAAGLYGGKPQPWESPTGPAWQLYTESSSLPCMVIIGYSLVRMYELWEGATKCVRRCDGITEQLTDQPCICNAENVDKCDTVTRLMVMLPETGTSLGWKLRSTGEIAADELDGAMMVAEKIANGRPFVPATLRLTQRRSVSGGQTKRYVVPVLDFNLMDQIGRAGTTGIAGGNVTYTPLELPAPTVTVEQGLAATTTERKTTNGRQAAPIPDVDDIPFGTGPVPVPDAGPPIATKTDAKITTQQARKLNVLVGKLRPSKFTTEQIYKALAKSRNIDVPTMIALVDGQDEDGVLHWGPLRDTLTKAEASDLIERWTPLEETSTV